MSSEPIPLFVLSSGRSYSTVVSAMLGRHPQMYAFPEMNLLVRDTLGELFDTNGKTSDEGLVRAVCDLVVGAHTEAAVAESRAWIESRGARSTRAIYDELARASQAAVVVEKTPTYSATDANLARLERLFGERARYVHLTRHPVTFGRSLYETYAETGRVFGADVTRKLATLPEHLFYGVLAPDGTLVPEDVWYARNERIGRFLATIDPARVHALRGEDLVNATGRAAADLAAWLGLPLAESDVAAMREPEKWRFAPAGPSGARRHGDRHFTRNPKLREADTAGRLDGPLPWPGRSELPARVVALAKRYGYG